MALLDSGTASSFTATGPPGSASTGTIPEPEQYITVGAGTPYERIFDTMAEAFEYAELQRRAELKRQEAEEAAAKKQQEQN